MDLKQYGFFSELNYGDGNDGSLKDLISTEPQKDESRIVDYLKRGSVVCVCPGVSIDELSTRRVIIGSLIFLTDGKWMWPSDLAYYVEKYHVKLCDEFLAHMSENQWAIPEL